MRAAAPSARAEYRTEVCKELDLLP